jgi:quinol monooxygenase YgiN
MCRGRQLGWFALAVAVRVDAAAQVWQTGECSTRDDAFTTIAGMSRLLRFVSLHPYFKVPADKLPLLKAILPEFVAKTRGETGNLFYEFTVNGDEVFCREGYVNAEALLEHLDNVGAMLEQALTMAELIRLEVHGPAAELEKLREPLAHLNPAWFVLHG